MKIRIESITNVVDDRWTIELELDGQHESMVVGLSDDQETYDEYKTIRGLDYTDAEREIIRLVRDARAGRMPSLPVDIVEPTPIPSSTKNTTSELPAAWLESIKRIGVNRYRAQVYTNDARGKYDIEFLSDGTPVTHAWPDDGIFYPCRNMVYELVRQFHERGRVRVKIPCELVSGRTSRWC